MQKKRYVIQGAFGHVQHHAEVEQKQDSNPCKIGEKGFFSPGSRAFQAILSLSPLGFNCCGMFLIQENKGAELLLRLGSGTNLSTQTVWAGESAASNAVTCLSPGIIKYPWASRKSKVLWEPGGERKRTEQNPDAADVIYWFRKEKVITLKERSANIRNNLQVSVCSDPARISHCEYPSRAIRIMTELHPGPAE